jgi:hypothetical protein
VPGLENDGAARFGFGGDGFLDRDGVGSCAVAFRAVSTGAEFCLDGRDSGEKNEEGCGSVARVHT